MSISWCGENNFEKVKEEIQSIINTNQEKNYLTYVRITFRKDYGLIC